MANLGVEKLQVVAAVLPADSRPLRVLHLNSGNLYGGVETILVTLAQLRDQCPTMEPVFALCQEGRLSRELREAGVRVEVLGKVRFSRPWTKWLARRRLREILRRERFDLVICHMPWTLAAFGATVKATGHRLGFWAHGFHTGSGWLERLARRTTPDVAIANSRFTQAGVENLFPHVPSNILYAPVGFCARSAAARSRAKVRRELGVSDDTVVIIQVSRLEAWKGHLAHLEALAQLRNLSTPWVCWMAGGAQRPDELEYLRQLESKRGELGLVDRVQFLGQRADVNELLAAADIFCQPNQEPEPFGLVFVEALWAGRPVITSDLGGAREILDRSWGVLNPPGDTAALAATLRRFIEGRALREEVGRQGPGRAWELCEPAKQMKLLDQLARRTQEVAGKL